MELEKVEAVQMPVRHQLARMVLASVAGFIAHKLVENAYDVYFQNRYGVTDEVIDI